MLSEQDWNDIEQAQMFIASLEVKSEDSKQRLEVVRGLRRVLADRERAVGESEPTRQSN